MLRRAYWRIFGYPSVPPRGFIVTARVNRYTGKTYLGRKDDFSILYNKGFDVAEIAKLYNVTRERVRQCIWRVYWENNG